MSGLSKKIQINKRLKGLPRKELEKLNKTELIDKIVQLEAYNFQLKNILKKKLSVQEKNEDEYVELLKELKDRDNVEEFVASNNKETLEQEDEKQNCTKVPAKQQQQQQHGDGAKHKKRKFDFASAHKRHVLLQVLYFGWDYQGFACQEDSNDTIEYHIFNALTRSCLIETRASSNYHRCGRTDKQVSAFCQVISINLRSKFPASEQLTPAALAAEINYCTLLNRILPKNIQCVAWMPLRSELYSARFDCTARTYRYFFPQGDLNIEAMRKACQSLQRHTDFRNFCKMDVHNGVTNYMRNLQHADVQKCSEQADDDDKGYTMFYLEIQANAFLWHQIRCIMAVLLLVGQAHESPDVINELLDVNTNPCKPQYTPAIGLPLNLFHCEFRKRTAKCVDYTEAYSTDANVPETSSDVDDTTEWIYNAENLQKLIENVQSVWTECSIKCSMIRSVLQNLEAKLTSNFETVPLPRAQVMQLQDAPQPRQYQKLLQRKRCESLENRIAHFVKKQRLVVSGGVDQTNANESRLEEDELD